MNLHDEGGSPSAAVADSLQVKLPGARTALILLLAINLINYIDRYILAAILPKIEEAFLRGDPYAKTKLGALTMGFLVSYMILSMPFGWLADRMSRWFLIGVGVILWSLASGASGLSSLVSLGVAYWMLLATRCFVGVGEAAYGPVAPSLISDMYPVQTRGKVLACFFAAIPVGSALGYVLGGHVEEWLGWPWAFYLVVPPGIALGLFCFFMHEPKRGQADPHAVTGHKPAFNWKDYMILFNTPSWVLNTLGMTALTFAVGGISVWMPYYIYEREGKCQVSAEVMQKLEKADLPSHITAAVEKQKGKQSVPLKDFRKTMLDATSEKEWNQHSGSVLTACCTPSLKDINSNFGMIVVISGLFATLAGGWAGDALRPRYSGSYFLVSGLSMMVGFPMVLLVLWFPFPLAWVFVFLSVFFLFFNTGPTNTILANVTHPSIRATGFALNILIIHAFGDAVSPAIIGLITDMTGSMDIALAGVSAVVLMGGVLWLWGAHYLARDTELAATRM